MSLKIRLTLITTILLSLITAQLSAADKVQYFGYWGDGMAATGTGNYLNQTVDIANVHYVSGSMDAGAPNDWREKVLIARSRGHKVVLNIENVVFKWDSMVLGDNREYLMSELQKKLEGVEDSILGAYLADEPFWKKTLRTHDKLSDDDIKANLQTAAILYKKYFPGTVVMLTEASPAIVKGNVSFAPEIDWVGPNCYYDYLECRNESELDNVYQQLYKNLAPNQKMFFTLNGYTFDLKNGKGKELQELLIKKNEEIIKVSGKYPNVAFFPFIYQTFDDTMGVQDMPLVKDYLIKLYKKIADGSFVLGQPILSTTASPNQTIGSNIVATGAVPGPGCKVLEPKCETKDWVRRDSCGKELGRWVNAPEPFCVSKCKVLEPKCEDKDYVRRDSCGVEIERWKNAPDSVCKAMAVITPPGSAPQAAFSECRVKEPTCEGADWVRRDSCGKELGRWKNAPKDYCPGNGTIGTAVAAPTTPATTTPAPTTPAPTTPAPTASATTSTAADTCQTLEPTCEGKDWVRRDSCGKELGRWVNAPEPYCVAKCKVLEPKCEGKDWVRRDSCGEELGRWKDAPKEYCPQ